MIHRHHCKPILGTIFQAGCLAGKIARFHGIQFNRGRWLTCFRDIMEFGFTLENAIMIDVAVQGFVIAGPIQRNRAAVPVSVRFQGVHRRRGDIVKDNFNFSGSALVARPVEGCYGK